MLAAVAIAGVVAYLVLGGAPEERSPASGARSVPNEPASKSTNAAESGSSTARAEPPIDPRARPPKIIGLVDPPAGVNDPAHLRPATASVTPWTIASRLPSVGEVRLGMTPKEIRAHWPSARAVKSADDKISALVIEPSDRAGVEQMIAYVRLSAPHTVRAVRFVLEAPLRGLDAFDALIRARDLERGPLEYFDEPRHIRALWRGPNWMSTLAVDRQTGQLEWSFEHVAPSVGDHESR